MFLSKCVSLNSDNKFIFPNTHNISACLIEFWLIPLLELDLCCFCHKNLKLVAFTLRLAVKRIWKETKESTSRDLKENKNYYLKQEERGFKLCINVPYAAKQVIDVATEQVISTCWFFLLQIIKCEKREKSSLWRILWFLAQFSETVLRGKVRDSCSTQSWILKIRNGFQVMMKTRDLLVKYLNLKMKSRIYLYPFTEITNRLSTSQTLSTRQKGKK